MADYPLYQASLTNNGDMFVVRSDYYEEFTDALKNIAELRGVAKKKTGAKQTFICNECGSEAEYREGVSTKSGKPWKGVFCLENKDHIKWL